MHMPQNAFESNWYGPGSMNTSPREKKKKRIKKKPAKEIVGIDDDEDDEEGEGEGQLTHVTRPGGIHTQLDEFERSRKAVDLSTACGKWQHVPTVEGDTCGVSQ